MSDFQQRLRASLEGSSAEWNRAEREKRLAAAKLAGMSEYDDNVTTLKNAKEVEDFVRAAPAAVVDCYTPACVPCRKIYPAYSALANRMLTMGDESPEKKSNILFGKIDISEGAEKEVRIS